MLDCEPPPEDRTEMHRLFWVDTREGPWVMAWDYAERQWQCHGDDLYISPSRAAEMGWTYIGKAIPP